jgi:hypothetical protein
MHYILSPPIRGYLSIGIVSSWSEPDLGRRRKSCVKFIIEVAKPLVVVLVPALVVSVGGVSPPSVEEEAEEEWHDESGVKAVGMSVKHPVSFEGTSCPPKSAISRQVTSLWDQSLLDTSVPGMFLGTWIWVKGTFPAYF